MRPSYSLKKGLAKGIMSALTVLVSVLVFMGWADMDLWQLAETYLKPVLAGVTVGGVITLAQNFIKYNYLS